MELKKIIISPSNTEAIKILRELDKRKMALIEKFEKSKSESKINHNISDYYSNINHNGRKYPLIKLTFSKN